MYFYHECLNTYDTSIKLGNEIKIVFEMRISVEKWIICRFKFI